MIPFLKEVALDVLDKYGDNFSNLNFVFQNKRAGVYFKQYLGEIIGRTIWAPNIYEMQSLLKKITGLIVPDDLSLLFDLYKAFNQTNTQKETDALTFYEFYGIGEIILRDFVDIDSNLVDVKQIFRNIKDLKEIDNRFNFFTEEQKEAIKRFWSNFNEESNSKEKEKFLHLWNKLPEIYTAFTKKLLSQKQGHTGLIFREMANNVANNSIKINEGEKYIFIGFNALNMAQRRLFNFLNNRGSADFFWDADKYYIDDNNQEAGLFLRKNILNYSGKAYQTPNNLAPKDIDKKDISNKKIDFIGVALEVGQAKLLPQLLKEILDFKEGKFDIEKLNKTAIVIANEEFLFPVLYSLPSEIEHFNVTMGYPLKNTQLYALLNQYFSLHATTGASSNKSFYFKDVLHLIQNPIVRKIDFETSNEIEKIILKENLIYIDYNFINGYPSDFINLIFNSHNNVNDFLENLLEILYFLYSEKEEETQTNLYENEYLYRTYTSIKHLNDVLQNGELSKNLTIPLAIKIIKRHLENVRIPFEGKNLEGLQIMGVLETRNLDFENLIVIGMNEGVWLSNNRPTSFVSENLRYAFEMPVMIQQDAIYAYLFYRLIQKSTNITILYNNITGYNSSGELSRFAQQLIFESGLKIAHKQFKQKLKPLVENKISINKTAEIINILKDYNISEGMIKRKFSASALNMYLDCSLKFYFRYIANFKEINTVEEEISPATFGTIIHNTLELIYKDFTEKKKRKIIEKTDLKELSSTIEKNLILVFEELFTSSNTRKFKIEGNRLIIKEVVQKYIANILSYDSKNTPFEIVALEEEEGFTGIVKIEDFDIAIHGIIDRIDKKEAVFRIIDYKTGNVDKQFKSIDSLFDRENEKRNKAVFQTFLYAMLLKQKPEYSSKKTVPAIFDIRKIAQLGFSPYLQKKEGRNTEDITAENFPSFLEEYEEKLAELFTELYNIEVPFIQTEIEKSCSYCSYKEICNK